MMMLPKMMLWNVLLALAGIACLAGGAMAQAKPTHLVFWRASDIRDGRNVRFEAHPLTEAKRTVLIPADPNNASFRCLPTDAVPTDDGILVYYLRTDNNVKYAEQRIWCLGFLRKDEFVLPDLKLFPQSWAGPANVALTRSPHDPSWGGFNVFQVVSDLKGGYRLLYWDQPDEGKAGGMLASSPDGIHWTKDERKTAVFTETNDAYSLVAAADGSGYILYQTRLRDWPEKPFPDNLSAYRRVTSLRRSPDLVTWTGQEIILEPDDQDAPSCEFYLLKVFRYCDRYVGLIRKYYADPTTPGKHGNIWRCELIFSDDGARWERPYRYTDMVIWSYATPFEHDGDLCVVARQDNEMSLYRMRRDGMASCGADGEGSFCTKPFVMRESGLTLNADCRGGSIGVEALDAKGQVLEGFGADQCRFSDMDGTSLPLKWAGKGPKDLAGKTVQCRFVLKHAKIFSVSGEGTKGG